MQKNRVLLIHTADMIISVRELKGIYLFYYLIDAAEFSDFNDMH